MTLFLSAKQIVDLLYQFKFLDYIMVVAAAGLVVYKAVKEYKVSGEKDFAGYVVSTVKKNFCLTDVLILILAMLVGLSLLRNLDGFSEACAIESAFLVYLLGRVYGKEVLKAGKYLAYVGYAIIYVNGSYYLYKCIDYYTHDTYPYLGEGDLKNSGALYYYKTDLGIAILFATVFIYCFSKALIAKYVTIFIINVAFLFHTNARTSQAIYVLFLICIVFIEIKKRIDKSKEKQSDTEQIQKPDIQKKSGKLVRVGIIVSILIIILTVSALHLSPVKTVSYDDFDISAEAKHNLDELFHWRQVIWWDTLHFMINDSPVTELIGVDLNSETFVDHNSIGNMAHSMYLTVIYGMGIVGFTVFLCLMWSVFCNVITLRQSKEQRMILLITVASFIIFLIMGLTTDALEYTQISWFPFIFAGMAVSEVKINE
ncbi:MAG: O-antigen ligase family protein [Lachnospiraceae bacterium]|nr:O-antigen ligase family protein [Lachnospiraceae bacterium]